MKIDVSLKIILLILFIVLLYKFEMYVIFFISIVIHELAHAGLGICLGLKIKKIRINPLGINLEFMSFREKNRLRKKICIYLIGPVCNFFIAILFLKLDSFINFDLSYALKINIVYTNLILGIFNLLPILPLDGGKILKEFLNYFIGYKKSNIVVLNISKLLLVMFSLVYSILIFKVKNIFLFFVIVYLWYLYYLEDKKLATVIKVYNILENVKV